MLLELVLSPGLWSGTACLGTLLFHFWGSAVFCAACIWSIVYMYVAGPRMYWCGRGEAWCSICSACVCCSVALVSRSRPVHCESALLYVLARGAGGLGAAFVLWRALQGFTTASSPGLPGTVAFAVLCILLHCLAGSGTDYIQLIASQLVIHIPCLGQLFDHLMGLCVCCSAPSAYLCLHV
mmetsp:Transcript_11880/g.16076  ORF Transcript_11880/g.16076 Transcript_11880/m.16076 type:complete len:181 (-) Transcript_11880:246-788(-)